MTTSLFWYQLMSISHSVDGDFEKMNNVTVKIAFKLWTNHEKVWAVNAY